MPNSFSIWPHSFWSILILFLIFAEKTIEFIFFWQLMRKIRELNRRGVEMAEEVGIGGKNCGGEGNG
jgi:hypothetical protein